MNMKRIIYLLLFSFFAFSNVNAQSLEDYVSFSFETNLVILTQTASTTYPMYVNYYADDLFVGTYTLAPSSSVEIAVGTDVEVATFEFFEAENPDDKGKLIMLGLATIDDIDLKIIKYGFTDGTSMPCTTVSTASIKKVKLNGQIMKKACYCSFYDHVSSNVDPNYTVVEFENEYISGLLPITIQTYCGPSYNRMLNPNTINSIELTNESIVTVFDMNGRQIKINSIEEIKHLSVGVYAITIIEDGELKHYKFIVN